MYPLITNREELLQSKSRHYSLCQQTAWKGRNRMKYISTHLITSWGIVFSLLVNKACIRRSGRRERLTWSCTITQERVEGLMAAARQQEEGGARCRQRACQARAPPRALRRLDSKKEQGRGEAWSPAPPCLPPMEPRARWREHAELEGLLGHFCGQIRHEEGGSVAVNLADRRLWREGAGDGRNGEWGRCDGRCRG